MKLVLIVTFIHVFSVVNAQQSYNFNQLDSLQNIKKKNVLVFVSANWCSYCKAMNQVVFKDADITKLLDQKYYFVRLNAEDRQLIVYKKRKFVFNSSLGFHEMAILLAGDKKLIFPSIYLLNYDNEILYQHQGFINSDSLLKVINTSTIND